MTGLHGGGGGAGGLEAEVMTGLHRHAPCFQAMGQDVFKPSAEALGGSAVCDGAVANLSICCVHGLKLQ